MIHGHRLKNKAKCAQRIWDERAEQLAQSVLQEALGSAATERSADPDRPPKLALGALPDRFHNLLALNVHRLAIDSCHPGRGFFPGPRGKRFCLEVAIRARLYQTDLADPVVDEIYSFVPEMRVGHESDRAAWPIPEDYMYEMTLSHLPTIKRTYHEYCDEGGFDLVEDDLRQVVERMVPRILYMFCITPEASS